MKKCRVLLLPVLVIGVLAGCFATGKEDNHISEHENITLRVAWWGGQLRNEMTSQILEKYEKLNPHVKIAFESAGFDEYWKKMSIHAAGNTLPDIIQMDLTFLKQYTASDLLEDLTPYTHNGLIDITHISESNLSSGILNGKLYGFNLGVNALYCLYDPEVFKANGIEEPKTGWTWSDFDAMGEQLKLQGKGILLGGPYTPEQFFAYYLRQFGYSLFARDGTKLGYDDDRLFVEYFGRMQRLAKEGLVATPDTLNDILNNPGENPVYKGQSLFGWGYSNQFIIAVRESGKPLKIVPLPGPHVEKGMFLKPGMFFSISKSSKHKEEAARLIDYFVNNLEANMIMNGERGVPVSSKVMEGMLPSIRPELAQVFEYISWVGRNSSPIDPPDPPGAWDVFEILGELNDQLLFGRLKPEDAAIVFRKKANEILAQYQP